MELNNTQRLSKDDHFRIALLKNLSEDYINGKEKYETMPQKVNSLLSMISNLEPKYMSKFQEYWGKIKLIQAEAIYDKKTVLEGQDKEDFYFVINKIKELSSNILTLYPPEPEDPYAWPFEEYK
jgi:hypothetical protein